MLSYLGADVGALVPFCPAQFNRHTNCLRLYDCFWTVTTLM